MLKDRVYKFVYKTKTEFKSKIWIYGGWKIIGVFQDKQIAALSRLETLRFFKLIGFKEYKIAKRKLITKIGKQVSIDISLDKSGKKLKIKSKVNG